MHWPIQRQSDVAVVAVLMHLLATALATRSFKLVLADQAGRLSLYIDKYSCTRLVREFTGIGLSTSAETSAATWQKGLTKGFGVFREIAVGAIFIL
jgi:hypothetical protein